MCFRFGIFSCIAHCCIPCVCVAALHAVRFPALALHAVVLQANTILASAFHAFAWLSLLRPGSVLHTCSGSSLLSASSCRTMCLFSTFCVTCSHGAFFCLAFLSVVTSWFCNIFSYITLCCNLGVLCTLFGIAACLVPSYTSLYRVKGALCRFSFIVPAGRMPRCHFWHFSVLSGRWSVLASVLHGRSKQYLIYHIHRRLVYLATF